MLTLDVISWLSQQHLTVLTNETQIAKSYQLYRSLNRSQNQYSNVLYIENITRIANAVQCHKDCHKFSIVRIVISFPNATSLQGFLCNCRNDQQKSKFQKYEQFSKIILNCWKLSNIANISKQMSKMVRVCLLITLIECLKGHRCLRLWLSWLSDTVTYWAVGWTAKRNDYKMGLWMKK